MGRARARTAARGGAWARLVALFLASALLFLSLSRLVGAALALPSGPALIAIREGRPLADEELARAVAATERSLRWGATPAASLSDLALLKLVQIRGDIDGSRGSRLLPESLAAQAASLALAPADSDGWARLTYARYALSGLDWSSLDALEMSFRSGRLERAPMAFRLQLILREWDALDPETRARGEEHIHRLAAYGYRGVDALTDVYLASDPEGREIIRAALAASSLGDRVRFERRLRRKTRSE